MNESASKIKQDNTTQIILVKKLKELHKDFVVRIADKGLQWAPTNVMNSVDFFSTFSRNEQGLWTHLLKPHINLELLFAMVSHALSQPPSNRSYHGTF